MQDRFRFTGWMIAVVGTVFQFLGSGSYAQTPAPTQPHKYFGMRGTVELGGSVSFASMQNVVKGTTGNWVYDLSAVPYAGYFILDGVELGINPAGLSYQKGTGDSSSVQLRMLFAPSYNFHTSTMVTPFVEGLAGLSTHSLSISGKTNTISGFTWGGRVGIKSAVTDKGLLVIGVQYLQITLNPSGSTSRNGFNEFSIDAGWTVWL